MNAFRSAKRLAVEIPAAEGPAWPLAAGGYLGDSRFLLVNRGLIGILSNIAELYREALMKQPVDTTSFSFKNGSDVGVLLIHGFTSTPASVRYVGEGLAGEGFDVDCPLLSGHGRSWREANACRYQDWLDDVERAYAAIRERCSKVFTGGLSMGGALSLYLAENHPEISGVFPINHAAVFSRDWRMGLLPILKKVVPSLEKVGGDLKNPDEEEITFDRTPLPATHELIKMVRIIKDNLPRVTQPCLIFKSREDHIIPVESAVYTLDAISSKEKQLIWLENSYHVATQDYDRDIIVSETIKFIRKYS